MSIPQEWQEFLREQFPAGSQIKVSQTADERRVAPGTTGKRSDTVDRAKPSRPLCPDRDQGSCRIRNRGSH